ncbi:MAG TPA: class I SAM-dependent methyltransferase [Anaerolineaceae bacterium]|nr:class I SAM-dependent methyltransferase [Anaerolineaceae bacterium]
MQLEENTIITCPLCSESGEFDHLQSPLGSEFWLCDQCDLIFMDREFLPDRIAEKDRYETHQNGPQYPGYVTFLNRAIIPTLPYLNRDMLGLDYGCGPKPTLSILLEREGIKCDNYDPFFYPTLPQKKYDFVFSTETAEHFFDPRQELMKIQNLLKPGGIFTIMTVVWQDEDDFSAWYYAKDFTHVSFYHQNTINQVCKLFGFELLFSDEKRVFCLRKTG